MKKLAFISVYFGFLIFSIFFLILASLFVYHEKSSNSNKMLSNLNNNIDYKSLPAERQEMDIMLTEKDMRVEILKDFFSYYKSPLLPYANKFVSVADKYNVDYRLVPAIAMQESNLCKRIPKDSYNCWGFGIYGKKVTRFSNYDEAIETVTKTLANKYIAQGYIEPHQIMTKYTPSSNGSWGYSVAYFMGKLAIN